jgi:hypothetical protein
MAARLKQGEYLPVSAAYEDEWEIGKSSLSRFPRPKALV